MRKTFEKLSVIDNIILKNKLAKLKSTFTDTAKAKTTDYPLKDNMKIVGIRLDYVFNNQDSIYDEILQEGYMIKVLRKLKPFKPLV